MDKYDKLQTDLTEARKRAEKAAERVQNTDDLFLTSGGVSVYLPDYKRERVKAAAMIAEVNCFIIERFQVKEYSFKNIKPLENEQVFEYLKAFEMEMFRCEYPITSDYRNYADLREYKKSLENF